MFRPPTVALSLLLSLANASADPLDCARATKVPDAAICADPVLRTLETEAARLTQLAAAGARMTASRRRELLSSDASFRKTLRACDDAKPCLQRGLIEHIHGLRQGYPEARSKDGEGISQGPKVLACSGFSALIGVTFVNSDPAFAFLASAGKAVVLTRARADVNAPYSGTTGTSKTELSIKGKQAMLDLPGKPTLNCDLQEGE